MHKLVILGVFALLSTSKGDVKHVLDGSAQLPHHSASGNFASQSENAVVPGSATFWWSFPSSYRPSCEGEEKVCVPSQLCINGMWYVSRNVSNQDVAQIPPDGHCESGKQECCRLPIGTAYTIESSGSSSATVASSSSFSSISSPSSFANLSQIANGTVSSPDSIIKFNGGAGLSSGSIQIVSDEEPIPNPLLTSGVKGGSAPIDKIKLIKNTYNNNAAKPVFASTIDYTNDKLDDLSFNAAFQDPQYLPPFDGTPLPGSYTPELKPPSYITYQPSIPTTYRPQITAQHFSSSQPQYQPSTSRPQYTQSVFVSSVTTTNEYLPPYPTYKASQPPINTVHIPTDTKVNTQYVIPIILSFHQINQ